MSSGTIKRLVRDRGFGFIRDDGGQEWFFHRSSVQGSFDQLNEGQRVSFDEEPSAKGPRAGNVRGETDVPATRRAEVPTYNRTSAMAKVLLFDIDGTLVLTGGAGGRAMTLAFKELFDIPDAFQEIFMPGRTDAWIVSDAAAVHSVPLDRLDRFHDVYLDHLV